MRILHVLGERAFSGGEVQLEAVVRALAAGGHESRFVLQPDAAFARVCDELRLDVTRLRMPNGFSPLAAWRLRRCVRDARPDLVHLADGRTHKLGCLALRGRGGPPSVVTRRLADRLRRGPFARWTWRRPAAVVAVSEATAAALREAGVEPARIHVVHDGIDLDRFADLGARRGATREALGIDPGAPVVACVATLGRRKGQALLVRALPALREAVPGTTLLLAGAGPEHARLAALARADGVADAVLLPGRMDARDALAAADVVAVPSSMEGLSVLALEAQAAGLPVAASDVGGLPEAIEHEGSGLLVAPGSLPAWTEALARLLGDGALRAALGEAGRARARERFDIRDMAAKTVALYERLGGALSR